MKTKLQRGSCNQMVLLDWGFMIRSHRIEFSVMCSGPVMYIHPVRMGVHMLKPKLHEQTVSRGSE